VLHANAALAQEVVRQLVPLIGGGFDSPAHHALATAIITDRKVIPAAKRAQIEPLAGKYLLTA
jgi:5'-methylthioadenosine phosphorylase